MELNIVRLPDSSADIDALAQRFLKHHRINDNSTFGWFVGNFVRRLRETGSAHNAGIHIQVGNHGDPSVGINGEEWTLTVDECQTGNESDIIFAIKELFNEFCEFPAEYIYLQGKRPADLRKPTRRQR